MAAVGRSVGLLHLGYDEPGHQLGLRLLIRLNPESWITVENLNPSLTVIFLEPFYICCGINYSVEGVIYEQFDKLHFYLSHNT